MIINKPGIGPARPDPNRRTILTSALTPPNDTAAPAQRKPNPEPGVRKRHDARDRMELEAAITKLAADGNGLLDDMEGDDDQDPFDLADRFGRSFDERAGATFAPIADPARKASAFRKLQPVRARLMAAARIMQEEAADRSIANTVFTSAEAVFARAQKDPEETAELLERVAGVIDVSDLTPERKEQVAAAVAARAVTSGLEDMLGPRIKKHVNAGRLLLTSLETGGADRDDASTANANHGDPLNLGDAVAQNNVPPSVSPLPAPQPVTEDSPVQTDSVQEPEPEEDPLYVRRISGLLRGKISPIQPGPVGRLREEIQPGFIRHADLANELRNFFQFTLEDDEMRVRELAHKADLNEDIAVLFHDFFQVTPDNLPVIKARIRNITDNGQRGPLLRELRVIAASAPGDRQAIVDQAVENIARFYVLALPLSEIERTRARHELMSDRFKVDFDELVLD